MSQKLGRREFMYIAATGAAAVALAAAGFVMFGKEPESTQAGGQVARARATRLGVLARSGYHQTVNYALFDYAKSLWPGLEFEYEAKGYAETYQTAVLAMQQRSDRYDILYLDEPWLPHFKTAGWLEGGVEFDTSGISEHILKMASQGGRYIAAPTLGNFCFLFYNSALLDRVGEAAPKSWDDVLRITETINTRLGPERIYGWVGNYNNNVSDVYMAVLLSMGGHMFDPSDGVTPVLATASRTSAIEAMRIVKELADRRRGHPKTVSWQDPVSEISDAIKKGEVAMGLAYSGWIIDVDNPSKSRVVGQINIAPPPGRFKATVSGVWYWGVPIYSKKREEAREVVKIITSKEAQKYALLKADFIPARATVYQDPEVRAKIRLAPQWVDVILAGYPARTSPIYMALLGQMNTIANKAVLGEITPEEAVESIHRLLVSESQRAGVPIDLSKAAL
ncbi:MAG: extracellular solute-binding protein [Pyrobaculum sp.]